MAAISLSVIGHETVKTQVSLGDKYILEKENNRTYEIQLTKLTYFNNNPCFTIIMYEPSELWDEFLETQSHFSFNVGTDESNEPISDDESTALKKKLNLLRGKMKENYVSNENQNDIINKKLDYIIESMKRQGKIDWVHTSIGVLATIAVSLELSAEQAQHYWQTIKSILGSPLKLFLETSK